MTVSRKKFLIQVGSGALALVTAGCGGGGDDPDSSGGVACVASITGNHGHVLTILPADLDSPTARTYDIKGDATHSHTVTVTAAQLAQLKAGSPVSIVSTVGAGHSHEISGRCS